MTTRCPAAFALAVIGLVTLSCGGIVDPSKNVTDTFPGTLTSGGAGPHPFSVSKTGEFTAKVTAFAPNSTALFGLAWVLQAGDGSCSTQILQQNNFASLNSPALGGQIFSGKYCIVIYDVGTLPAGITQNYTLSVSHP